MIATNPSTRTIHRIRLRKLPSSRAIGGETDLRVLRDLDSGMSWVSMESVKEQFNLRRPYPHPNPIPFLVPIRAWVCPFLVQAPE